MHKHLQNTTTFAALMQEETNESVTNTELLWVYPAHAENQFQFEIIRKQIEHYCHSDSAKLLAQQLKPKRIPIEIITELNQTQEFKSILENGLFFPPIAYPNIQRFIPLLSANNAVLDAENFIAIRKAVETALAIIRFLKSKQDTLPYLCKITEHSTYSEDVVKAINSVIEEPGIVKSNASKHLSKIRNELSTQRQKAARLFAQQLKRYQSMGFLVDFSEGVYNGRRVLAVLAENKRKINGIIHGSSDTGKVTYIEPAGNVEVNNAISELENEEKREVYRILRELTKEVGKYSWLISEYERILAFIDYTRAKANFAIEINAVLPQIHRKRITKLINAYHPVLWLQNKREQKPITPLNIELNNQQKIVVISGPNAGGKSIAMKTVGLLQFMLQSGLLVPTDENSKMHLFESIFVDIGDDQSIEHELSTYSSRLKKMKYFLEFTNNRTLFFIDEFGTGSDPELGGVMAETILEDLSDKDAFGVVTTHYSNIKLLADNKEGIRNACMLYDQKDLAPKYELYVGQPGSSFTFEVANKTGLSKELIARAKSKLNSKKVQLDKLIVKLQREKSELATATQKALEEKREADAVKRLFSDLQQKLQDRAKEDAENRSELNKLVVLGQKYQKLINNYTKTNNKKDLIARVLNDVETEIKKAADSQIIVVKTAKHNAKQQQNQKKQEATKPQKIELKVGDRVQMLGGKEPATIEEIKGNLAIILLGVMKLEVQLNKLQLWVPPKKKNKA